MITATFRENQNTGDISFKSTGHAQSAPKGEDLICAAASAFALQATQSIRTMERQEWLEKPAIAEVKAGRCYLRIRPKPEYRVICFNMLQVVATGYQVLAETFPKHVELHSFGNA